MTAHCKCARSDRCARSTYLITRFIPLLRDVDMWQRLYHKVLDYPSGTLATYCGRGWCRLELLAALAPKKYPSGAWRSGSVNLRFRYHDKPDDAGAGPLLRAEHILNPMTGRYVRLCISHAPLTRTIDSSARATTDNDG